MGDSRCLCFDGFGVPSVASSWARATEPSQARPIVLGMVRMPVTTAPWPGLARGAPRVSHPALTRGMEAPRPTPSGPSWPRADAHQKDTGGYRNVATASHRRVAAAPIRSFARQLRSGRLPWRNGREREASQDRENHHPPAALGAVAEREKSLWIERSVSSRE
jgi:hypothetical protein